MAEKWLEIYSQDEIDKIQSIELESLKVFGELCDRLGIEFYLYGGSLLGAVKYQGFVPWDDDLDIALMREDYDKLIEEGPQFLPDKYELQHPLINKITPYPYIKFRYKDSKMVEFSAYKLKMNHGVYFDIYPLDNIPDNDIEYNKLHKRFQRLVRIFLLRQKYSLNRPVTNFYLAFRAIVKFIIYIVLHIIPHRYLVNKMRSIMIRYNNDKTLRQGNYFYPRPVNYFNGITPAIDMEFENMTVKIPKGYLVNLKNRYGDISELPPEENRFGHKPYKLEL